MLFIYYTFELFFHILVENTNYIHKVVDKTLILVTPVLVQLDSRASTDSPFLGTGSDLTAGCVLYMCRYGTLDSQRWYVQCSEDL